MGSLYAGQVGKLKVGFCDGMGFGPEALDTEGLTIATGPRLTPDRAVALAVGFGIGVGFTVEEPYLKWAHANRPAKPFEALDLNFIGALVAEGARRGETFEGGVGGLGFALDRVVEAPPPPGYGLAWLDRDALEPLWNTGVYHNALGRPNRPEKFARILWAAAIRDASADLAAVAGAWEESFLPACSFSIVRRVDPVTGSR